MTETSFNHQCHASCFVGGILDTSGMRSFSFQVLNFDSFSWTTASSKLYLSPTSLPLKIPACKGHALVSFTPIFLVYFVAFLLDFTCQQTETDIEMHHVLVTCLFQVRVCRFLEPANGNIHLKKFKKLPT